MKPHIQYRDCGLWMCCHVRYNGQLSGYKMGIGYTAREAYEMWARINDVN